MKTLTKGLLATGTIVFGVTTANAAFALALVFSDPTPDDIGINGTRSVTFSLDASTQNLSSVDIDFEVGELDEGFELVINGTSIFNVPAFDANDPGHPIGVTPGLASPWNSLPASPRISMSISESVVSVEGLLNANDVAYTPLSIFSGITLPNFIDGLNTVTLNNINANGPGGLRKMAISGTVDVPEPTSLLGLLALGAIGATQFASSRTLNKIQAQTQRKSGNGE